MGFAFPAALLFGLVLILASLSLFIVSKVKPNLYEESDSIYVVLGIVCGLLLLISLELSAAMAFQQLLLLSATITLMWRFINLRAENKQLKNRQSGGERPKAYNARLEDEYAETPRERRQGKRRRNVGYEDEERRLLGDSRESAAEPMLSRRRGRSFDAEDSRVDRYDERRDANTSRRQSDWDDEETEWNDAPAPRTARRALPDADRSTRGSERRSRRRDEIPSDDLESRESRLGRVSPLENREPRRRDEIDTTDPDVAPRRRQRPPQDRDGYSARTVGRAAPLENRARDAEGSMGSYVNYEPIVDPTDRPSEPPSGLPSSGSEPIVFPDRY
jgi:Ycf66 protein N-terminus